MSCPLHSPARPLALCAEDNNNKVASPRLNTVGCGWWVDGSSCRFIAAFIVYAHCATAGVELKLACTVYTVYTQSAFHSQRAAGPKFLSANLSFIWQCETFECRVEWQPAGGGRGRALLCMDNLLQPQNRRRVGETGRRVDGGALAGLPERLSQVCFDTVVGISILS